MSECPACKKPAIARWKMAFLSPFAPLPCDACDTELTVSWPAYLTAIVPSSIVFIFAYFGLEESSIKQYVGYGIGLVLMWICQIYFMPLSVKQDSSSPSE